MAHVYEVTIDGVAYEVESPVPLTPRQAYEAALQTARAAPPDAETRRLSAAFAGIGAGRRPESPAPDDDRTQYQKNLERQRQVKEAIEQLEQERQQALAENPPGPAQDELNDYYLQRIAALKKELPRDWAAIGGAVGNVVGGVAGGLAGAPALGIGAVGGAAVGSTVGGLLGTILGGLADAQLQGMDPEETRDHLTARGIESVVLDTAGNLLFVVGGKAVSLAKSHPAYKWVLEALGGTPALQRGPKVDPKKILPGERVFPTTSEEELRSAAAAGARSLTSTAPERPIAPTVGQLTDDPGLAEHLARVRHRAHFQAARRQQEELLTKKVDRLLTRMRAGAPLDESGHSYVREALEETEKAVKDYLRPTWEALRAEGVRVDMSTVKAAAEAELERDFKRGVPLLQREERVWLKRLADAPAAMNPADAHALLSRLSAKARDLTSTTQPNSALLRFYTLSAQRVRETLDEALARAPQYQKARELYGRAMSVLYDDALMPARRAAESAADARVIRVGEVEGMKALEALRNLASEVDTLTGRAVAAPRGQAAYNAAKSEFLAKYAGTPDALALLPSRMRDPDFRRAFGYVFRTPQERRVLEVLSQAAQQIQRLGVSLGTAPGVEAAGASFGGAMGASTGSGTAARAGSFTGRFLAWLVPETLSAAMTHPTIRAELPRIARIAVAAAQGTAVAIPDSTRAAIAELDRLAGTQDVAPPHGGD